MHSQGTRSGDAHRSPSPGHSGVAHRAAGGPLGLPAEDVRLFWEQEDGAAAIDLIDLWIREARRIGIEEIIAAAKTMERNKERILAWYDHPITTARLAGLDNKIKVLQRRAYGYRDTAFFLRVLLLRTTKFRLSDV